MADDRVKFDGTRVLQRVAAYPVVMHAHDLRRRDVVVAEWALLVKAKAGQEAPLVQPCHHHTAVELPEHLVERLLLQLVRVIRMSAKHAVP